MAELVDQAAALDAPAPSSDIVSRAGTAGILVYLGGVALALMYFLIRLWPEPLGTAGAWNPQVIVFWRAAPIKGVSDEMRLLLLVMVTGGLGSFIHAATSFVDYVGNRRFMRSWMLWYLMRPIIGSALAVVLYVAVRGGLLSATTGASQAVSPYGVASLGCLAGMFSKQATDKLNEIFSTLFKTGTTGDATRKDKLDPTTMKVESVEPAQLSAGGPVDVALNGSGFESMALLRVNGQARQTTFVSAGRLTAKLDVADIAAPGTLTLTVDNPSGHSSPPVKVIVTSAKSGTA